MIMVEDVLKVVLEFSAHFWGGVFLAFLIWIIVFDFFGEECESHKRRA
jgi:hypothetical protein